MSEQLCGLAVAELFSTDELLQLVLFQGCNAFDLLSLEGIVGILGRRLEEEIPDFHGKLRTGELVTDRAIPSGIAINDIHDHPGAQQLWVKVEVGLILRQGVTPPFRNPPCTFNSGCNTHAVVVALICK